MSYRNREIEVKLVVPQGNLEETNVLLRNLFEGEIEKQLLGSSVDTYWNVQGDGAQFIRMRERDGIRQITVKSVDRGTNLNRLEVDVDSTSDTATISRLLTACHGKPIGRIAKTYYVYWLDRHTTVCVYEVTEPADRQTHNLYIEVETTSEDKLLGLEAKVVAHFNRLGIQLQRASGSLYEMYLELPWENICRRANGSR